MEISKTNLFNQKVFLVHPVKNKQDAKESLPVVSANPLIYRQLSFRGKSAPDIVINPLTNKPDEKLQELKDSFKEKLKSFPDYETEIKPYENKILDNFVLESIDKITGKTSPIALDFLNKYFFEEDKTVKAGPTCKDKANFGCIMDTIFEIMKDKNDSFSLKNSSVISELMESEYKFINRQQLELIRKAQNRDDIITDRNYDFLKELLKLKDPDFVCLGEMYDSMLSWAHTEEKLADRIFNICLKMKNGNKSEAALVFFKAKDNLIGDNQHNNIEFIEKLAEKHPRWADIAAIPGLSGEDGLISPKMREKIIEYAENINHSPDNFREFAPMCRTKDGVNEELFEIGSSIYDQEYFLKDYNLYPYGLFSSICDGANPEGKDTRGLIYSLNYFKEARKALGDVLKFNNVEIDLKKYQESIEKYLEFKTPVYDYDNQEVSNFLKIICSSSFGETVKSSTTELENYKNAGLPLRYTRKEFLSDLSEIYSKNPSIKDNLGVDLIVENGKITDYNGIIDVNNIDKNSDEYKLCHKFFFENKIETKNKELNNILNSFIKANHEFINIAGKKGENGLALDTNSFLTLANSFKSKEYKNLTNAEKFVLNFAALYKNFTKNNDPLNTFPSLNNYLARFIKNEEVKDRIINLIKNRDWLEIYQKEENKDKAVIYTSFEFRRGRDFEIAKIISKANMQSIGDDYYGRYKTWFYPNNLKPIKDEILNINAGGCAIFPDYPVSKNPNNNVEHDGHIYNVINLKRIDPSSEMKEFGFEPGKTRDDLQFLVHMTEGPNQYLELNVIKNLLNIPKDTFLSESLISCNNKNTFGDRTYGVVLSQANTNTISASNYDQFSGFKKAKESALRLMHSAERGEFSLKFLENLGIEDVDKREFAEFYKNNIANKTSLSQFIDSKEYKIGQHTITGKQIKNAIQKYQNYLTTPVNNSYANEIVGYRPKIKAAIAKWPYIVSMEDEFLKFVRENDLPLIII